MPVATSALLNAPLPVVWAIVSDFSNLMRWHPDVRACETTGSGEGAVRRVSFDGWWAAERLERLDPERHVVSYTVIDSDRAPTIGVCGTITLAREGDRTRLHWVSGQQAGHPDEEAVNTALSQYYPARLGHLRDALEDMTMSEGRAEIRGAAQAPFVAYTVSACMDEAARLHPDRVAVKQYDPAGALVGTLSHAQLREASCRLAGALAERFQPGDVIALWGSNSLGWLVYELAILRIGATLVTLDPALRGPELSHILDVAQVRGIAMDEAYRGVSLGDTLAAVRADTPPIDHVLAIADWRTLADGAEPFTGDAATPDSPALVVFTSGTTGKPKGVILSHAGVVGNAREAMVRTGLSDGAALLNPLPAYSVGGAVCINLGALTTMRPQIIVNHFDAGVVIDLTARDRIGWMPLNPAMMVPLLNHPGFADADLSALEAVWMGGTVITPENVATARRALGVHVVTIYGQTESGGVHSMNAPDASAEAISATVGTPLPHGRIRIADLTTGETVAPGVIGEIRTQSPYRATGYFRNDAATADLFDGDGWLHTGDLGLIDGDGNLRITGRLKEMIIRGGRNIYPREIEDVLTDYPGIVEVAVVGVPHERWGEEIAVAVRGAPGAVLNLDAARAFLGERIAAYKIPRYWRQVEDFPRGGQAKIRKVDLVGIFTKDVARA